jgi:nucleotide-binding universal stress UspA family protein
LPWLSRENRKFLGRAVRFCAQAGITQFLDIGSGLPTMENVHEVAGQAAEDPHVVYVDSDPVVISHARPAVHSADRGVDSGDLTRPEEIRSGCLARRAGPRGTGRRQVVQAEVDSMVSDLGGAAPASVTVGVASGSVVEELINAAKDADMLVVGSRGAGGFTRLMMGSVSSLVTQYATCPVVIIPPADRQ